jgi:hypothetical protein
MVILDILALASLPITVATVAASRHQQSKTKTRNESTEEQLRMEDFHIDVYCDAESRKRKEVDGTRVILRDGRLWLSKVKSGDASTQRSREREGKRRKWKDHKFKGFYLNIQPPEETNTWASSSSNATGSARGSIQFSRLNKPPPVRGLVSTIPPAKGQKPHTLNWIYVDPFTFQVRYGPQASHLLAQRQILGPFHWTSPSSSSDDAEYDGSGLTLEGWEGFVAVEEEHGQWSVYFDRNDDLLGNRRKVGGRRVLRISLERRVIDGEDSSSYDEESEHTDSSGRKSSATRKGKATNDVRGKDRIASLVEVEWEIEEIED